MKPINRILSLLICLAVLISCAGCFDGALTSSQNSVSETTVSSEIGGTDIPDVPESSEESYAVLEDNKPDFEAKEIKTESYEYYSPLDKLGRCGVCYACIGKDIMPTEERGEIGQVKPTGWHTVKYDIVSGKYLYNRCHLIGYQLTGENANERNLITGTRYLNIEGMLPFENLVADYIKETGNHVMYRVTPDFHGSELVARGVRMEGWSVEDNGEGVCFDVYCYNVQPGIKINYSDGTSELDSSNTASSKAAVSTVSKAVSTASVTTNQSYILNTNTKKFHKPGCSYANDIKSDNKQEFSGIREQLINMGYEPCKKCNP